MKTRQRLLSGCLLALLTGCPSANDPYRRYALSTSNNVFGFLSGVPSPPPYVPSNPPTRGFPLNFEAAWSPDGQQLALLAYAPTSPTLPQRVYLLDASGQIQSDWAIYNPAVVFYEDAYLDPHPSLNWASDGSLQVLQLGGQPNAVERIFLHRLRPGMPVESRMIPLPLRLNDPDFRYFTHPALSPDHQQLAFFEHLPNNTGNYSTSKLQPIVFDLNSRVARRLGSPLTTTGLQYARPVWSLDQSSLYLGFSTEPPKPGPGAETYTYPRSELFQLRLSDGQSETLYASDDGMFKRIQLSPDGKFLLLDFAYNTARPNKQQFAGPQPRFSLIPQSGKLDYGANLMRFNLETRHGDYFSTQSGLSSEAFWHGSQSLLLHSEVGIKPQIWRAWDAETRKFEPEQKHPDTPGLSAGTILALSPPPARQLVLSLYTPCCSLEQLRTGAYRWDMQHNQLSRIGPDLARLTQDFPGVGLHERPQYDYSQANKDIKRPAAYPTYSPVPIPSEASL